MLGKFTYRLVLPGRDGFNSVSLITDYPLESGPEQAYIETAVYRSSRVGGGVNVLELSELVPDVISKTR